LILEVIKIKKRTALTPYLDPETNISEGKLFRERVISQFNLQKQLFLNMIKVSSINVFILIKVY